MIRKIASVIIAWFASGIILATVLILVFHFSDLGLQLLTFCGSMILCTPVPMNLAKHLFPNPVSEKIRRPIIDTGLPTSGVIHGPDFELPDDYTVEYREASKSPVIFHHYDSAGNYRGFLIDFGNGKVGIIDGSQTITGLQKRLCLFATSTTGTQKINWK